MDRRVPFGRIFVILVSLLAAWPTHAAGVEALFELGNLAESPFPSDFYTVPDDTQLSGLRVNLPPPLGCEASPKPSACGDVESLNTFDGFNLQPRISITFSGPIDVDTVTSDTVFLVGPSGRTIGIDQVVWDVETNTLHVESEELLDQHTRYVVIVTREVRDLMNEPVEAAGAFQAFRHGRKIGHADDGVAVTAYRTALRDGLELAASAGVDLNKIAVASVFTTQSVTSILEKIRDQIKTSTEPADFGLGPLGARTTFRVSAINEMVFRRQLTADPTVLSDMNQAVGLNRLKQSGVGMVGFGRYRSPDFMVPCDEPLPCDRFIPPVGTRTGSPVVRGSEDIYFNVYVPSGIAPEGGWPVAIFGFGSGDTKNNGPLGVAVEMASRGMALVAINGVGQGLGPASLLRIRFSEGVPGGVVERTVTFPAGGRSFDQDGDGRIGSGVFPTSEGLESLSLGTFIARRDARRQSVADLMQLARVIQLGVDVDGDGVVDLNPSRIYYFGFSHGADVGTIFAAVEPLVRAVVLTAVGGNVDSFRLAPPGNRSSMGGYLSRREPSLVNAPGIDQLAGVPVVGTADVTFNENVPPRDGLSLTVRLTGGATHVVQSPVINTAPGAMEIQRVFDYSQWLMQANDPVAYAPYLRRQPLPGNEAKRVIVQLAKGDQVIPNPANTAVIRSGGLADRATLFRNDLALIAHPGRFTKNPHTFILPNPATAEQLAVSQAAQRQIALFFAADGNDTTDPDGPCLVDGSGCLFETPIPLPLPEDLNFIP